ncbi:MAG: choice-of-anchor J domain-containing protein [Flavobacteriaceae bacterium]
MKKLLLSLLVLAGINASAQTTLFLDDFEDGTITDWTLVDSDGDGNNWIAVNMTVAPIYKGMRSNSWITTGALTPDNWAITPGIDIGFGGDLTLTWDVVARDPAWDAEKYSVYISDSNTVAGMMATTPVLEENTLDGVNVMTQRSVTVPAGLNGTIYIGFRHFGVSDQFTIDIDNVKLVDNALKTNDFFSKNYAVYPNPANSTLNIASKTSNYIQGIELTDLNGRVVKNQKIESISATQVNISELNAGVYFLKITSNQGSLTTKIVKK